MNTNNQNTQRQSMATSGSAVKQRQLTQLHSQLAQLSANLSDTENLLRMTSVQAECMRGLGSWHGGLFMAASKVLGEESVREQAQQQQYDQGQKTNPVASRETVMIVWSRSPHETTQGAATQDRYGSWAAGCPIMAAQCYKSSIGLNPKAT
ncbi:High osmolarity sensitivity protein 3 [Cytospora mali]|uniref:High osmolarity sensitivity protein 3 n=1 Tax=Cytospora mali TaxID=578113 RepID=A0A194WDJ9_CYTMA|nr:High osmolarity sensitivity protein 3 [Valsa mali]